MRKLVLSFFLLLFSSMTSIHGQVQTSKIDSLLEVLPRLHGADLADASLELADAYLYLTPEKTIEYGEKALALLADSDRSNELCYAKLLIGTGYIAIGEFNKGEEFITPALSLARKIKNAKYISIGLSALAAFHMNTGNYAKAMELFKETLEKATQAGLPDWEARAKLNIGSLLTNQGDRAGGLRYMTEALAYFESSGNAPVVARIMNNIAVNYHAWRDYDLALKYYRKTLRAYEVSGDLLGKVVVLNNIGEIYKDKGQYDMALQYYDQIFDLAENNSISDFYLAIGKVGLAETYLLKGNNSLARDYANQSLHVFDSLGMKEGEINANLILSQVNMHEDKLVRANEIVDACLIEAKAIGLKELIQKAYLLKSEILQKQKDDSGALENYKKYVAIADSLKLEKQTHQLALHRAELDLSEKENEIELLQKDNEIKDLQLIKQKSQSRTFIVAIALLLALVGLSLSYNKARKRANDLLQQKNKQIIEQHEELLRVNQTKDKFLSIIGHDLRNPIGAFKDMVSQLAEFPEMFDEALRSQILEELRDEAESTYFLLDNLLLWAKAQKNSIQFKPEKLKLNLVIKNNIILNSRTATRKKIDLKANIPEEVLVYADHNMVDLVVRNLLSNALKFTPENGKVDILVKPVDANFIEVSIKDTGVGIAENDLPRLLDPNDHLSTYGTSNEKGSGLGLVLCREFIEMNGGKLEIQSRVGRGSTFSFTLKKYRADQA
ncbi:tetratricopeptide repeat-containing sensor histidine kinase [uncultured Sunxiuqinia sp.]|uniref:ATP-binding protein n=1 Tax=uncultured Sunxiuqinia sp. TaxID=1573825 RepID=UPI00263855CA|nr:tetratricopeptide repeat-containing sensor histidine kinase [uncultured Sunxiuqinia sp.]